MHCSKSKLRPFESSRPFWCSPKPKTRSPSDIAATLRLVLPDHARADSRTSTAPSSTRLMMIRPDAGSTAPRRLPLVTVSFDVVANARSVVAASAPGRFPAIARPFGAMRTRSALSPHGSINTVSLSARAVAAHSRHHHLDDSLIGKFRFAS